MTIQEVTSYIDENILNDNSFQSLDKDKQRKAIKTAQSVLYMFFKSYNPETKQLPTEALAYQTLWEIDKIKVRDSDLGIASQSIEGMTQTFRRVDRNIAPEVRRILGGRIGSYHLPVPHTNRHVNI